MNAPKPRSRSGTSYTEAELAERGVAAVKLRIDQRSKQRLEQLATDEGLSMSDLVETWIDREWAEAQALKGS